jgi:hypothetical protein
MMTYVYHYLKEPAALSTILREGLRPLSDRPDSPAYSRESSRFRGRYELLARPLLRRPYVNSGVFFTTVDLRRLKNEKRLNSVRLRIPVVRLDPEWSVLTYEYDGARCWWPVNEENLRQATTLWTDELCQRWLGADITGWFRYVPQVVAFQNGGVPVTRLDVDPAI